jgi:hypothetical protein
MADFFSFRTFIDMVVRGGRSARTGKPGVAEEFSMKQAGRTIDILVVNPIPFTLYMRHSMHSPCAVVREDLVLIPDYWWDKCPKDIMRSITWHEVGHIVHNHTGGQRCVKKEYEADMYSVEKMGKEMTLHMLHWLAKDLMDEGCPKHDPAIQELRIRYRAINKTKTNKIERK